MFRKPRLPLTLVGRSDITLNNQTISYTIKRSTRARHVRLQIRRGTGLAVVIPKQYPIGELPDLLQAKRQWVLSNLEKYSEVKPFGPENERKRGDTLPYLGQRLELVQRQSDGNADNVKLERRTLIVTLGPRSRLEAVLERWYRTQAANLIGRRADELSAQLGVTYDRLSIRGQRTRWASCSRRGNLSFNWKLMMAPQPVIDYVVIHELAHIKEMNHSKRFWQLVAEHCPHWRKHKKWLKEHETELTTKLPP